MDALHINRLGLELVGKQETALSELIKNSYDADAQKVEITFKGHQKMGGQVIISDDGAGMDSATIKSGWMRLSTSDKIDSPVSPSYGRNRAGRKGIGRFAVQRLGKRLILETEIKGAKQGLRVFFDWDNQFTAGKDIGTIWNKIEYYDKEPKAHGTKLIIDDLRDKWTTATLERVWKSVLLLQPPHKITKSKVVKKADGKEYQTDPGFVVVINGVSSTAHSKEISIKSEFLDHALAKITGSIDEKGKATFRVTSSRLGLDESIVTASKYLTTGSVHLEVRYFIYQTDVMPGTSTKDAIAIGHKYGGVRVYRDGFRVLPYGDANDDWLNLGRDTGRRHLLVPANNFNFFGHVEVSKEENPYLEETSGREGFIENEAFGELQDFTRACLEWAVLKVAYIRERKQTASQKNFKSQAKLLEKNLIDKIIDLVEKQTSDFVVEGKEEEAREALQSIKLTAESFQKAQEEQREESLKYEAMLRILASLGLSISIFGHEIKGTFNTVNNNTAVLKQSVSNIQPASVQREVAKSLGGVVNSIGKVFNLGAYISALMNRTESRELKQVPVSSVLNTFMKQFDNYLEKYAIEAKVDIQPPGLRTCKMHRSELDSVLFNFLTNSIKALDAAKQKNKKIRVTAHEKKGDVIISFQDNGIGIPEENKEKIFDPFFTTALFTDDEIAGTGTGLGLKIVSDIASSYGGDVRLATPSKGYSSNFEFRIPSNKK